jgi:hypothetical protein
MCREASDRVCPLRIYAAVLLLLSRLAGCDRLVCPIARDDFAASSARLSLDSVEEAAPISREELVVSSFTHPTGMALTRVLKGEETRIAATPPLFPSDLRASIFSGDGGWWFSRHGDIETASRVHFIVFDRAIRDYAVPVPRRPQTAWIPLPGPTPRGIYVAVEGDRLEFRLVSPSGVKQLGTAEWPEHNRHHTLIENAWSAQALDDDRIAVVTTDDRADHPKAMLHLFGDVESHVELPCGLSLNHPIDTAVDGAGKIGIAGLSRDSRVVTMIVHPDRPEAALCRVVSEPNEAAVAFPFGVTSVEWTGQAFVVGWIRDDGSIRACELRPDGARSIVVDIGRDASADRPLRRMLYPVDNGLMFVWRDRSGDIVRRWLPNDIVGHTVIVDMARRLCAAFDRLQSSASASP